MPTEFKFIDRGWKAIQRELGYADTHVVATGVIDGSAPHDSGRTMGEIATWNHYGTETIPARPFITRPIDVKQGEIKALIARIMKGVSTGKISAEVGLALVGQRLRDLQVSAINAREYEPNAESTVAKKGSDTPLVDTGQLKGAITYQVREK